MVYLLSKEPWVDRVLFVNPSVWVANLIKVPFCEIGRFLRNTLKGMMPQRKYDNVVVLTPYIFPKMKSLTRKRIKTIIRDYTKIDYVLLINCLSGNAEELQRDAVLSIFDWSDDFEQFTVDEVSRQKVATRYNKIISDSSIVFTINNNLLSRALRINQKSYLIPNATNINSVLPVTNQFGMKTIQKIRKLTWPIIGYAGWLVPARLDDALVKYIAKFRPEWNIVFVGPKVENDPLKLNKDQYENIQILSPVSCDLLKECIEEFDVCIIPNRINQHTKGNDPIKIYDYLAVGKPVVSTRTAGVERVAEYIDIADTPEDFLAKIEDNLKGIQKCSSDKRKEIGMSCSWDEKSIEFKTIIWNELIARPKS